MRQVLAKLRSRLAESLREERETAAERPHVLTLIVEVFGHSLTLLAVFLSAVSVYFTQRSLQDSRESVRLAHEALEQGERSLTIGQRAYLAVQKGTVSLEPYRWKSANGKVNLEATIFDLAYSYDLINFGNTPANDVRMRVVTSFPSNEWKAGEYPAMGPFRRYGNPSFWPAEQSINVGSIAQSNATRGTARFYVLAPKDDADLYHAAAGKVLVNLLRDRFNIKVKGAVNYKDVFGIAHSVNWCWRVNLASPVPLDCDDVGTGYGAR